MVFVLSFKIFVNMFAFQFAKTNSKKICEEIAFSFFQKNTDVSIVVEIQG